MDAAYRMLRRNSERLPPLFGLGGWVCDELAQHSGGIAQGDDPLIIESDLRMFELYPVPDEALHPEADRSGNDGERCNRCLTRTLSSTARAGPREESENRARRASPVAEVQMVCRGIVEIHRALDEAHSEHPRVEVQILLRVAGDCRDVVNPRGNECHGPGWSYRSGFPRRPFVRARTRLSPVTAVSTFVLVRAHPV